MDLQKEVQPKEDPSRGSKRKGLGRGISALIPESSLASSPGERLVPLSEIRPNPRQPRRLFDEAKIAELAQSIRQKGVLQPLVVRKANNGYELVVGERRLRAAQQAGLDKVPVIVREVSDAESLEMALIENIQREELTPIEEAFAYRQLMEEFHLTQEEVAARVGKSRPAVTNLLRLLSLPNEVKEEIDRGTLSVGHAKALLSLEVPEKQIALAKEVVRRGLSVRETESLVAHTRVPSSPSRGEPPVGVDVHLHSLEEELTRTLGTRVRIYPLKKGGKIEIQYYSDEELESLIVKLRG